jgi:hypothetical protein
MMLRTFVVLCATAYFAGHLYMWTCRMHAGVQEQALSDE